MENFGMIAISVFGLTVFILGVVGMRKEWELRVKYAGVFGRPLAYFFFNFAFLPVCLIISAFFSMRGLEEIGGIWFIIGSSVISAGLAILIAMRAIKRCPEELRKGLFPSMLLVAMGLTFRVALFFLPFIWAIGMPSKEEIEREAQRREREAKENAERAEEYSRKVYREIGKRPIINNENTKFKLNSSDLWEEIPS